MKWGVRRYQDKSGKLTKAGKQHVKDQKINKKIDDYIKSGRAKVDNLKHYTVGSLTTMTTSAGEQYVSGLIHGHDFDWQEVTKYNDYGNGDYVNPARVIKDLPNAHRYSDDSVQAHAHQEGRLSFQDLKACNPGFGSDGTTQNCAKCSASLELMLRGYSITAGRQTYPSSADANSLWFKDAKRVDYDMDFAEEALNSYGPMTSGTLSFKYPGGNGGHAVHWTNDKYGRFEIQDGQNGRTFGSISEMLDTYGGDKSASISTFRLDNCEPNYDAMEQDSVIRLGYVGDSSKVQNKFTGQVVDRW